MALSLHQLTGSKVQVNLNKVNNCKSKNTAGSYQRRCVMGRPWQMGFCKQVSFALWQQILHCVLCREGHPNLRNTKSKTMVKVFD